MDKRERLGYGEWFRQHENEDKRAAHDMSSLEKRKKDKAFGKMVKAVKKNKKRK